MMRAKPISDAGRDRIRSRSVQYFRDIHGTERVWQGVQAIDRHSAGDDHDPEYHEIVVCGSRRRASTR